MRRAALAIVLWVVHAGSAWAEEPVHFSDLALKRAVEEELWVVDPTPTDMLGLMELRCINFGLPENGISSAEGLQYAINLQSLDLRLNKISDVSPISGLTNLRYLSLSRNRVSDLSGLSGLINLEHLDLHGNGIMDISPLSGLVNMETLILRMNHLTDLSPLANLAHLRSLAIWDNEISDISPLSQLTELQDLELSQNEITDISALLGLTSLRHLDLRSNPWSEQICETILQIAANNPGINIEHDCGPFDVVISAGPGGTVLQPGLGRFTQGYNDVITLEAAPAPGFVFLGWSGTQNSQNNPDYITIRGDHAIIANFRSTSDILYVDDDAPGDPRPGDPKGSDPGENGTREHPFDRIQEALDVSMEGARICVRSGAYPENVDLSGRRVVLTGADWDDPNRVDWPVINAMDRGLALRAADGQTNCTVTGFVITGGKGTSCGAVWGSRGILQVANCLIVGNRATDGGGAAVYCSDAWVVLTNCTIADNHVTGEGQGAAVWVQGGHVDIINSILWDNAPADIVAAIDSEVYVRYSAIAEPWPGVHNTTAGPLFAAVGRWVDRSNPQRVLGPEYAGATCSMGDYHLQSHAGRWDARERVWMLDGLTSPLIDGGDPNAPIGSEPVPNGGIIDMGAYGGTAEASKSVAHP